MQAINLIAITFKNWTAHVYPLASNGILRSWPDLEPLEKSTPHITRSLQPGIVLLPGKLTSPLHTLLPVVAYLTDLEIFSIGVQS